jgi:hypothetical protein
MSECRCGILQPLSCVAELFGRRKLKFHLIHFAIRTLHHSQVHPIPDQRMAELEVVVDLKSRLETTDSLPHLFQQLESESIQHLDIKNITSCPDQQVTPLLHALLTNATHLRRLELDSVNLPGSMYTFLLFSLAYLKWISLILRLIFSAFERSGRYWFAVSLVAMATLFRCLFKSRFFINPFHF